jgi:hypothetical protein
VTAEIIYFADYRVSKAAAAVASDEVPLDQAIEICIDHPEVLTPWEAHFLLSVRQSHRTLSHKQRAIMQRLFNKAWTAVTEDNAS